MSDPFRDHTEGCELDLLVAPRAARSQIVGLHEDRLKVQLAAPPVDGAANAALCELLAERLGLPKSALRVVRGQTGRRKTLRIVGLGAALARARLGLAALLLLCGVACNVEVPFSVRVIFPEEEAELRRADNLALELAPQGLATSYAVTGLDFSVSIDLVPDEVQRTLALYLADGTELLAHGRSAPFVLLDPPSDLAILLARPGVLSTFPGEVPEPDADLLAARAPGRGLMLLGSAGDIILLNEFTYSAEVGARLNPAGGAPEVTDGALTADDYGLLWRVAWREGLRIFTYDPLFDVWTELTPSGDLRPRPGAAWASSAARDRLWIAGGSSPELLELPLDAEEDPVVTTRAALDAPRAGAVLVPFLRGEEERLLLVGGQDPGPALYLPDLGLALGPAGAWTGLQCAALDPADAKGVQRVLCLGGERGGLPTADALLLRVPAELSAAEVEELVGFAGVPLADPRLFADDLAIYAQQGAVWLRIARTGLTVTPGEGPATRERGGHSLALGTDVTFMVGGRDADEQPVSSWWVFAPGLPSP